MVVGEKKERGEEKKGEDSRPKSNVDFSRKWNREDEAPLDWAGRALLGDSSNLPFAGVTSPHLSRQS